MDEVIDVPNAGVATPNLGFGQCSLQFIHRLYQAQVNSLYIFSELSSFARIDHSIIRFLIGIDLLHLTSSRTLCESVLQSDILFSRQDDYGY